MSEQIRYFVYFSVSGYWDVGTDLPNSVYLHSFHTDEETAKKLAAELNNEWDIAC